VEEGLFKADAVNEEDTSATALPSPKSSELGRCLKDEQFLVGRHLSVASTHDRIVTSVFVYYGR